MAESYMEQASCNWQWGPALDELIARCSGPAVSNTEVRYYLQLV